MAPKNIVPLWPLKYMQKAKKFKSLYYRKNQAQLVVLLVPKKVLSLNTVTIALRPDSARDFGAI